MKTAGSRRHAAGSSLGRLATQPASHWRRQNGGSAAYSHAAALLFCLFAWACAAGAQTAAPVASPSPTPTPPLRTGSLKGRVLDDAGKPLPDLTVYADTTGTTEYDGKTAVTDAKGRFELKNLVAGAYVVGTYSSIYILPPAESRAPDGALITYQLGDNVTLRLVKGSVITGRVNDVGGQSQVDIKVQAIRLRDPDEPLMRFLKESQSRSTATDDRGVYRLYGLLPGRYIIRAGGGNTNNGRSAYGAYEGEAATYFPSDTRDTATVVTVQSGEEVAAIDIRHRAASGRIVSGLVKGMPGSFANLSLKDVRHFTSEADTFLQGASEGQQNFAFSGLPDGDYLLTGQSYDQNGKENLAGTLRVTVKGADVTGLELKLAPLASITGRVTLAQEVNPPCANQSEAGLPEMLVRVRRERFNQEKELSIEPFTSGNGAPDAGGEFKLRSLAGGAYRLRLKLPTEDWYLHSLGRSEKPAPNAKAAPVNAIPELITLATGQKLTGLAVNLSTGAAGLHGRVVPAQEGAALPRLRVYLVPAEREKADNTLFYQETTLAADGTFAFMNLAPGRYLLLARPMPAETDESELRPVAWDAKLRAQLRRDAETRNAALELKPCQRATDYELRFAPTAK